MKRFISLILALFMLLIGTGFAEVLVDGDYALNEYAEVEYGYDYYTPEEVALYLYVFWELPPNYITKDEAYDMGWDSQAGNLWDVAYGFCIGGDRFGNREGLLPDDGVRQWYECDVNYEGGYRGAERLLFSSDGLIYYTGDHYETFEPMYEGWYGNDIGFEYDDSYSSYYGY